MDFNALKREFFTGWNTYYNNSVLTHVHLPDGIAISFHFKFYNSGRFLRDSLIGRFGDGDEKIHPGPRSFDGSYTELNLKCDGHEATIRTTEIDGEFYALITPVVNQKRPPALVISSAVLWNKPGYAEVKDGRLLASASGKNVEFFTDGDRVIQLSTGLTSPNIAVELSRPVAVSTKPITAEALAKILDERKTAVLAECSRYGELSESFNAIRTCMAWDTIYEPQNDQICSPVSRLWSIGWGGYVLFDWDTYFSSLLAMTGSKNLAYSNVIAITHEKTENGFIPNFGSADDDKSRDRSQPPVGSHALLEIYKNYKEDWIVKYLFDDLLDWNRWFIAHRSVVKNGDGATQMCWGSDPYEPRNGKWTETSGVNDLGGAAFESGLDNAPMYDDVPFDKERHIMLLGDVGLTGLYINDCESLATLADIIGRTAEAKELRERANKCKAGLELMWDEEFGLYLNQRVDTGELSRRISPTNFYSLYSDKVTHERARRMIDEHFMNPDEFLGEYIMPSCARNDPAYPEQNYWRGRIWAPMNYLAYKAIKRHDLPDAAKILADKSAALLMKEWLEHGHIHENYSGDTGDGCGVGNSDKFYHWGALLGLIALTEAGYVK
ncbi:hypothetical protein FACS1894105_08110 [Clostridia bacterium]|nr:hypothetical protein FACS1894105_08110 [Clostridia bacterium]